MGTTYKTLYRKDSKGKTRVWKIGIEDVGTQSEIVIKSGLLDGKQTTQIVVVSCGKNIGKSNETTHFQQAEKETQSRIEAQIRSGYVEELSELKENGVLGSGVLRPMLAQKYDPTGKQKGSKTLEKLKLENKTVAVQPKLDGNRCIIVLSPTKAEMRTREGDLMPVQLQHILLPLYERYSNLSSYDMSKPLILDGELYDHQGMSFNDLNGLVKKVDASPEQIEKRMRIKYHLYDVMMDVGFEQRMKFIEDNFSGIDTVEIVRTDYVLAEESELRTWLEGCISQEYEGLIIRQLGIPYENKRTWQLLKYKQFEDFEAEVVDVEEDKRRGFAAAIVLKLDPPSLDRDGKPITTFKAGISGFPQAFMKKVWDNKQSYVGKIATIKHFGRSEYNVPRFGKLKSFN